MNTEPMLAELQNIRPQIAALESELEAVKEQTRSRAETGTAVEEHIAAMQARADDTIDCELLNIAGGGRPGAFFSIASFAAKNGMSTIDLGPALFAALNADAIKKRILGRLPIVPKGLDSAERAQRLAELEREIWVLGVREERLVQKLETAGADVCRRPNVDPRIVLAFEEDLERSLQELTEQPEELAA